MDQETPQICLRPPAAGRWFALVSQKYKTKCINISTIVGHEYRIKCINMETLVGQKYKTQHHLTLSSRRKFESREPKTNPFDIVDKKEQR